MMRRALILAACLALAGCDVTYSTGTRVGTVYKLSQKGFFGCVSWEGELALPGYRMNGSADYSSGGNVLAFTVSNSSAQFLAPLRKAMDTGEQVAISYREVMIPNPCATSDGYFVTGVKLLISGAQP